MWNLLIFPIEQGRKTRRCFFCVIAVFRFWYKTKQSRLIFANNFTSSSRDFFALLSSLSSVSQISIHKSLFFKSQNLILISVCFWFEQMSDPKYAYPYPAQGTPIFSSTIQFLPSKFNGFRLISLICALFSFDFLGFCFLLSIFFFFWT